WRKTNHRSKTFLRLFIVTELAICKTLEVVESRIAGTGGDGGIDHGEGFVVLFVSKKFKRLLVGARSTDGLRRGEKRHADDEESEKEKRDGEILVAPAACRLSRRHLAVAGESGTPPRQPLGRRRYQDRIREQVQNASCEMIP